MDQESFRRDFVISKEGQHSMDNIVTREIFESLQHHKTVLEQPFGQQEEGQRGVLRRDQHFLQFLEQEVEAT